MPKPTSPTPGQIAYEAYWRQWPAQPLAWKRLLLQERRAWEAAAEAAAVAVLVLTIGRERTQRRPPRRVRIPGRDRANGAGVGNGTSYPPGSPTFKGWEG